MAVSLADLVAAQRAYAQVRLQAIQQSSQQNADAATAAARQQQALLEYLQARAKLLADAKGEAMAQFDAEIARYQQKIGELEQIIRETASGAPAAQLPPKAPTAPPPATGSSDAPPKSKGRAPRGKS